MPTMTNPETGETKEISMQEFMKMRRSGNGNAVAKEYPMPEEPKSPA